MTCDSLHSRGLAPNMQYLQGKPETSPEVKMTELELSYLGYIMRRQGSLEKIVILGK